MRDFFLKNMFSILFALLGLAFVILVLTTSFWTALLIVGVILIGFLLGRIKDNNVSIAEFFANLFKKQ